MYRDFVKGNKLCYNFEQDRLQALHQKKLHGVGKSIKTQNDQQYPNYTKKQQLLEDKYTEIERENRILLEKIQHIMQNDQRRHSQQPKRTLNSTNRKNHLVQLQIENARMANRLNNPKSSYGCRALLRQTEQHQQLSNKLSTIQIAQSGFNQYECYIMGATKIMPARNTLYIGSHKMKNMNYYVQVFFEDNLFKITADETTLNITKVLEMNMEDGQQVLSSVFNNDINKLAQAIQIDSRVHLKGLEQFENCNELL